MHLPCESESKNHTNVPRSSQNLNAVRDTEIAVDGTTWKKLKIDGSSGRRPIHPIFIN